AFQLKGGGPAALKCLRRSHEQMFTRVLALPERGVCASHTVLACGDHMNKCSPAFWLRRKAGLALRARCAPAFRRDSHEQMFTRVLA
ncbi:hypothetical protein ABTL41_19800, partial [Acinetobacter baumannii]